MPLNYQTFINAAQLILNNLQNKRLLLKFCFSSASQSFRSPILGVNAKIGYQNYFNDFIGLAYYGIIKYNYAKASSEKVQQLSYGGGIDLLLDFITTYSNKNRG
ncbi:outer membrane beta-barrel protein [Helicobacter pylori]|uniref:outer membrane beta-barrel protein n=1 Tax=Helicobacter pylori TaxID=210 RepID=UPI001E3C19F6|nr:outer membrane beta-barrel protein [Helicobacter pylori]